MKISAIINALERFAPPQIQESWDNSGLQISLPPGESEVSGVLLCMDVSADIVAEAVNRGCNMIVSHHPLIFRPFKRLTGATPQEEAAMAAIRAGVAVYSAHTSLDSTAGGISHRMAQMLGLEVKGVIHPSPVKAQTLTFTCRRDDADDLVLTLLDAGAGSVQRSDAENEYLQGIDSADFDPASGMSIAATALTRISLSTESFRFGTFVSAAKSTVAAQAPEFTWSIGADSTEAPRYGLGVIADVPGEPVSGEAFIALLHNTFGTPCIKTTSAWTPTMSIRRVGLCGGSAPEFARAATAAGADIYVCGDIRYHDFADAALQGIVMADIGHFESEFCAENIFYNVLKDNFPNFAVYCSETEQNPVKYL